MSVASAAPVPPIRGMSRAFRPMLITAENAVDRKDATVFFSSRYTLFWKLDRQLKPAPTARIGMNVQPI